MKPIREADKSKNIFKADTSYLINIRNIWMTKGHEARRN